MIPTQRGLQENIAESGPGVADAARRCEADRTQCTGERGVDICLLVPDDPKCSNSNLSTQNGRCEYIGGTECNDVGGPLDLSVQVDRQVYGSIWEADCPRGRHTAAGRHKRMYVEGTHRQSGLQWCGCQTSERARQPKTNTALIRS